MKVKFENEKTSVIQHVRFYKVFTTFLQRFYNVFATFLQRFFEYIISKFNKLKKNKMFRIKNLEKDYIMPNVGPGRKSLQKQTS